MGVAGVNQILKNQSKGRNNRKKKEITNFKNTESFQLEILEN